MMDHRCQQNVKLSIIAQAQTKRPNIGSGVKRNKIFQLFLSLICHSQHVTQYLQLKQIELSIHYSQCILPKTLGNLIEKSIAIEELIESIALQVALDNGFLKLLPLKLLQTPLFYFISGAIYFYFVVYWLNCICILI
ncbi:Hypothetical_protein [Hexamita inflata]|uniref:Hypothetical_protein n=1 Tax=Hexamita inflata TaxID=28002 RepID=A0AA86UQ86_9EUKA|nr:Hypothetical protein HINF_LOCUS48062 [Hexamita inflata]